MHTSSQLAATDFTYWESTFKKRTQISFADFCPDYHELDRVGIVSPSLEEGILHTGRTLLALTTAFYDSHRSRGSEFFDYPQHFAFVGTHSIGLYPDSSDPWGAWRWLDVWPSYKWITVAPTATCMLQSVFEQQINRLFWPQDLWPASDEEPFPDYLYEMLRTRLKGIHLYSPTDSLNKTEPIVEVSNSSVADKLLHEGIIRLPESVGQDMDGDLPPVDRLQPMSIDEFIITMRGK